MARPVLFVPNYKGIGELLRSDDVRADLTPRAERVASVARNLAPGAGYAQGVYIEQAETGRAVVRVVAGVDYAAVIEFRERTLGRSIDAAGD